MPSSLDAVKATEAMNTLYRLALRKQQRYRTEQVVHIHRTLCRSVWPRGFGELNPRGFNKFLHKWVLKSNMRVYLPKARRVFDPLGVRGHAPPENFEVLDSCRCIFRSFFVALLFHFFAPKSTNLNKFEKNYVTMK